MNHVAYFHLVFNTSKVFNREGKTEEGEIFGGKSRHRETLSHTHTKKSKQAELSIPWFPVNCQDVFCLRSQLSAILKNDSLLSLAQFAFLWTFV